jgi:hypothetical protein
MSITLSNPLKGIYDLLHGRYQLSPPPMRTLGLPPGMWTGQPGGDQQFLPDDLHYRLPYIPHSYPLEKFAPPYTLPLGTGPASPSQLQPAGALPIYLPKYEDSPPGSGVQNASPAWRLPIQPAAGAYKIQPAMPKPILDLYKVPPHTPTLQLENA